MSDYCLNAKRGTVEVDGARIPDGERSWEDETPGNQYDTEETVFWMFEHNEVYDRLCPEGRQ